MSPQLQMATQSLLEANDQFASGALSSVGHRDAREAALSAGLQALAAEFGVTLRAPLLVDSRGEYTLVAELPELPKGGGRSAQSSGCFGDLAAVLNRYAPRTGVFPGAILLRECGWCYLNHFNAERMLLDRLSFASLHKQLAELHGRLQDDTRADAAGLSFPGLLDATAKVLRTVPRQEVLVERLSAAAKEMERREEGVQSLALVLRAMGALREAFPTITPAEPIAPEASTARRKARP